MKDLKKQIGTRIRNRRIQMHFTQESLAELANVTPQTISSAERGTKELRIVNFYQICIALEVSSEYLLFGKNVSSNKCSFIEKISLLSSKHFQCFEKITENFIEAVEASEHITK